VHERAGDIPAAEADFRAILEVDPENTTALNALGYTLADRTDRYEEAYELILRAYEQRPDDAAIVDSYGWVLYRLGRLEEALEQLQRAYQLLPDSEIASNLAVVLWELGRREESRAIIDEALQREPDHERLLRVKREQDG
jgi:Flp pilus assembly protein TadD